MPRGIAIPEHLCGTVKTRVTVSDNIEIVIYSNKSAFVKIDGESQPKTMPALKDIVDRFGFEVKAGENTRDTANRVAKQAKERKQNK